MNDRFQSTISWIDVQGTETVLLRSVEGTPNDDFPPSPPLQQMHLQEINGAPVLLAVGMAGRGHWSASIMLNEAVSEEFGTPDLNSLVLQYAANLRNKEGWAGCTWIASNQLNELSFETIQGRHRLLIRPFGLVGCEIKQEPSGNGHVSLIATPTGKNKSASTVRWELEMAAIPIVDQ